jgi:hypothetical protein
MNNVWNNFALQFRFHLLSGISMYLWNLLRLIECNCLVRQRFLSSMDEFPILN